MKRLPALALALAFAVVAHAAPGKGTGLSSPVMTNFNKRDFLITLAPGTAPTNIIQLNWGGYTIPNPPAYDLPGTIWYIITNYISTNLASTNVLINPTDDYLPVRSNATTFVDSPLYRVALTNIATDGQIIFGPGTTNVLKRSVSTLQYTNGAADVHFTVLNGSAVGVALEAQSATSVGVETTGSPTVMFLRNGADQAAMVTGQWRPGTDLSLSLGNVTAPRWANVVGTNLYAVSFVDNATNYSRLSIYQPDTNSPVIFDQQTANSAGYSRGFSFRTNNVEVFAVTGTGGPSSAANWVASGTTNSTLPGNAFVHSLLPTNGLQSVSGASATYIGTADIWNMGVNSSSASAIYNNCYSFYNFGTNSAHGVKATNSYSIWNFGLDGLEDSVLNNARNVFNFGADPGWQSQYTDSYNIMNLGFAAGESTLYSGTSHDIVNIGQGAGHAATLANSGNFYMIGNEPGDNIQASGANDVYAFGSGLKNAVLGATKRLFAIGGTAGNSINGAYTNVVLIGDGATIGATGENQIIAGPGMNMSLPGTLSANAATVTNAVIAGAGSVSAVSFGLGAANTGIYKGSSGELIMVKGGTPVLAMDTTGMFLSSSEALGWSSNNDPYSATTLWLLRDDANTLGIRNSVNAQRVRVYNTWSSGADYERGVLDWITTPNSFTIGTEMGGTGSSRNVQFRQGGTNVFYIDAATGALLWNDSNTRNIGSSGGNKPGNLFVGTDVIAGANITAGNAFLFPSKGSISSPSDGIMRFSDNATTGFNRIQFGGTTASFPSLQRNGTGLVSRLADDSSDTSYRASQFVITGTTNQLIFGSTNTAPVSSAAPTKWISVQVSGETNIYRLPLYE